MKPIDRQFRQLAFVQVLLGMVAFCIAEGRPVLLVLVGLLAGVSWLMTEGRYRLGLDRNLLNLGAIGAVALLTFEAMITRSSQPVALVGHFTIALQLVLLFAIKTRREYVQLAVLSPLQMIAASVLPGGVSLLYGVLLVLYCFVTLLTALTFQLKSASDLVHQRHQRAAGDPATPARPDSIAGPYLRLNFRLSALAIGLSCGLVAAVTFLVIPRARQDPFAAALISARPTVQSHAGFNNRIKLGGGSIGGGSTEPVLNVSIQQGDLTLGQEGQSWLLRGAVQDAYDTRNHVWSRPPLSGIDDFSLQMPDHGLRLAIDYMPTRQASITLRRKSMQNLFTVVADHGPIAPVYIDAPSLNTISFSPDDQQLDSTDALASVLRYSVQWVYSPYTDLREQYRQHLEQKDQRRRFPLSIQNADRSDVVSDRVDRVLAWSVEPDRVRALAQRVLRMQDLPEEYADASAGQRMQAAIALSDYLRRTYHYTLDNPSVPGTDPVIAFLFQTRAGHCELFASGLAAMCRTIGIPARLATGYRASEYNSIGGYYVVRESHAHAWTEVDLGPGDGWHVLDPTPPDNQDDQAHPSASLLGKFRALYDHLEFNWIATVITYDRATQRQLLGNIGAVLNQGPDRWLASSGKWLTSQAEHIAFDTIGKALVLIILLSLSVAVYSLVRLFVLRHRRMVALQLTALPRAQQRVLARQLRFYINMLEMLERHGRSRAHWQSPFQFARALTDEQPIRFEPVIPLTEMFYEVRFGYRELDSDRLSRVRLHLRRLEQNLGTQAVH